MSTTEFGEGIGPSLGERFFPDSPPFAFQTQRLICEARWGGGDASEVSRGLAAATSGDFDSWHDAWLALGDNARGAGESARAAGHDVTARERLFAAANYFRSAEFFLPHEDPRAMPAWQAMAESFRAAADLSEPGFEWFDVPYEDGVTLPAYLVRPAGATGPRPTVVYLNGADGTKEESWLLGGKALLERGMNFVTLDGPGQGEPLRRGGVLTRPDYEVAVAPLLDLLVERGDVDADRIALVGISMGGYYGARVAAKEPRFACVALHGACFNIRTDLFDHYPPIRPQLRWITGTEDDAAAAARLDEFDLTDHAAGIEMPIYITHGTTDKLVDIAAAHRLHDAVRSTDRTLHIWKPEGLGGSEHCSVDNPVEVYPELADWVHDRLR